MYPNPQDVLPLPPRPDLEQYRRRAKDLVRACESGDERAFHEWASRWLADLARLEPSKAERAEGAQRRSEQLSSYAREQLTQSDCGLAQAQFVIARAHGFASWPRLVRHLEELS